MPLTDALLQVLSDDEKRSIYDRYGEAGLKGAGMGMGVSIVISNLLLCYLFCYFDDILAQKILPLTLIHKLPFIPGLQQPVRSL